MYPAAILLDCLCLLLYYFCHCTSVHAGLELGSPAFLTERHQFRHHRVSKVASSCSVPLSLHPPDSVLVQRMTLPNHRYWSRVVYLLILLNTAVGSCCLTGTPSQRNTAPLAKSLVSRAVNLGHSCLIVKDMKT